MSETSGHRLAGAGIGLRAPHYSAILQQRPDVPWFEALTENYFGGGAPLHHLEQVRALYPVTLHGVGLSLGSTDPLDPGYLQQLKLLIERIEPASVSDHLAWISVDQEFVHDLLPMPYTGEALDHVIARVHAVQEFIGRTILLENPSSYLRYRDADMSEPEFMAAVALATGCGLLLDVNNLHVTATNNGFSPIGYIDALPADRIREIHLAGYEQRENYLFDTHGAPVHEPVWALYQETLQRTGNVPTLIEWDTDIPALDVLIGEMETAQHYLDRVQ